MEDGVPIESRMLSRKIEGAQKGMEAQHFESRKHVLEYDDVMNKQREAVYGLRHQLLKGIDQKDLILEDYVSGIVGDLLDQYSPANQHAEQWDVNALKSQVCTRFGVNLAAEGVCIECVN